MPYVLLLSLDTAMMMIDECQRCGVAGVCVFGIVLTWSEPSALGRCSALAPPDDAAPWALQLFHCLGSGLCNNLLLFGLGKAVDQLPAKRVRFSYTVSAWSLPAPSILLSSSWHVLR